jgi:putative CocE/NonD family hydrolase
MEEENLFDIRVERNLLIPLVDGATLAADLYCPDAPGPFPTLVSFYPYHKDDLIGGANEWPRRYFAARGYACLLVDFRGLGSSSGVAWDAMDSAEGRDGAEMIEWAAGQPFCDGNVGMWGLSYGAISSFKTAAEQPPHLKAIVGIEGTLALFLDLWCNGGCPNMLGAYGAWGSFMLAMNLMPPTNIDRDGRWYRVWSERLEHSAPYILPWHDHPTHDAFWQSRAVDVARIKVPTFCIGGWRDIFPEAMPAIYAAISAPKRFLMGPWMHTFPDLSPYDPVDYLHDMRRWFDRWLRGIQNGIETEPPVTVSIQGVKQWRSERKWPIARAKPMRLFLSSKRLLVPDQAAAKEGSEVYTGHPSVGVCAGLWDPTGLGVGLPFDQGTDDRRSICFTSAPMAADTEISGAPATTLRVSVEDGDDVHLVAKLCDVAPDGASSLITSGWLKGTMRNSLETPEPLLKGHTYDFKVALCSTSYLVRRGHRIRLSISCSDFPRIWPTKRNPTIRVFHGPRRSSSVRIPVVTDSKGATIIEPRRPASGIDRTPLRTEMVPRYAIEHDLVAGSIIVRTGSLQSMVLPNGGSFAMDHKASASVADSHPEAATVEGDTTIALDLPSVGKVEVATTSWVTADTMALTGRITINGREFFSKTWRK